MVDIVGAVAQMQPVNALNTLLGGEQVRRMQNQNALFPAQQQRMDLTNQMLERRLTDQNALREALQGGDLSGANLLNPTVTSQFMAGQAQIRREQARELLPIVVAAKNSADPGQYARAMLGSPGMVERFQDLGLPIDPAQMPDNPEDLMAQIAAVEQYLTQLTAANRPGVKIGAGDSLIDPVTGQEIYKGEADPNQISETDKTLSALRKEARSDARKLEGDIGTRDIVRNFNLFKNSIKLDTAAGDIASIIAVAKMMDPNSVVREGEVYIWNNASGPLGILKTWLDDLTSEKGAKLSVNVRKELAQISQFALQSAEDEWTRDAPVMQRGYRLLAERDPDFLQDTFASPFADLDRNIDFDSNDGWSIKGK